MNDNINRQQALDTIRNIRAITGTFDDKILLIDKAEAQTALMMLPPAESKQHYCRECKWSRCHINLDKYGRSEIYWHCLNWDGGTDEEGFCHEWERREDG